MNTPQDSAVGAPLRPPLPFEHSVGRGWGGRKMGGTEVRKAVALSSPYKDSAVHPEQIT